MAKTKAVKPKAPKKEKKPKPLTPMDILKMEVAEELGLLDKVKELGWAGLTASETGRVGGVITRKLKERGLVPKSGHSQKLGS